MTLKLGGSSSGFTELKAPAAAGSNTLVLPADNGSANEYLQTNGSGTLSWNAVAGGKILQIQAHTLADEPTQINSNTDTWVDTGLTQTIELADNTNKVLVIGNLTVGNDSFGGWSAASGNNGQFTINRAAGTDPGNKGTYVFETFQDTMREHAAFIYLDSPTSTDELTYKIQFRRRSAYSGTSNVYVFGGGSVTNSLYLLEVDAT